MHTTRNLYLTSSSLGSFNTIPTVKCDCISRRIPVRYNYDEMLFDSAELKLAMITSMLVVRRIAVSVLKYSIMLDMLLMYMVTSLVLVYYSKKDNRVL